MTAHERLLELRKRMGASIIGQQKVVDSIILGLLADGNLLLEGLPGLAKTRAVKALASNLDADLNRIQFTPDLLPSDITGSEAYHQTESGGELRFEKGPLFANLVLADEINRAPAKVQAALLEAMEERQVTVAGTRYKLPELFMVLATQNPIEQEGTYPLPEAQMDRFLMHVRVDYPPEGDEIEILRLVRGEQSGSAQEATATVPQDAVFEARAQINAMEVAEAIDRYVVDLVWATRDPARYSAELATWIKVGASPRGTIALDRASRAHAWMAGHDHVTPDDVREVAHNCLRHRVALSYDAHADGVDADAVLDRILEQVAVG